MRDIIYFNPIPSTAEELKRAYRTLAMANHPDRGGDVAIMQTINAEYDHLFAVVGDVFVNREGHHYQKQSSETPEYFKDLISQLVKLAGITIEIIGSFVWVTGETKPHKEALKALGFRFSGQKAAWYLAPENWKRRTRKNLAMEEIRGMFGVYGHFNGHEETDASGQPARLTS